ncbi:ketoacyl-ACP synthase III [Bradyrhizobium sp.]|uniref:ketoacyl-ACP synthase III n=1 Tax=Bradyrhizobium sp. TaxID=376 RepID=UPI003C7565E6
MSQAIEAGAGRPVKVSGQGRRVRARIGAIASYLPDKTLSNDELAALFPEWPSERIYEKTGIRERRVAGEGETASDLAYMAAKRLFAAGHCKASDIDFIIFCTQAPDYFLPTSACLLQERLGVPRSAGALDVNLGCSGYVYCLALAKSLIESDLASNVLLLTADTYSKFIHPLDKSVRTLFGDGAAATLVIAESGEGEELIGPFVFGTDGTGARNLIVEAGAFRRPSAAIEETDAGGRTAANLYMDGGAVLAFTLSEVPAAVEALLVKAGLTRDAVDHFVLHQANKLLLESLRKKMRLPAEKVPIEVENCGNTVSSSIPIALEHMLCSGSLARDQCLALIGFGVGYSWAAAIVRF